MFASRLASAQLYGILDTGYCPLEAMPAALEQMIAGGIDVVQLRAKGCTAAQIRPWLAPLHERTQATGVPFIINDFPELAALADGVHVGQDDAALATVRATFTTPKLVGKSTHSLSQALQGAAEGADYLGFGPLFPTPTKAGRPAIGLDEIAEVHRLLHLPIFCIGGIKRGNLPLVIAAGARRVVIVSGVLQAIDIPSYLSDCRSLLPPLSHAPI